MIKIVVSLSKVVLHALFRHGLIKNGNKRTNIICDRNILEEEVALHFGGKDWEILLKCSLHDLSVELVQN